MIVVPASLRSDFIHMAGMTIHIALESTIHIVGIRTDSSNFEHRDRGGKLGWMVTFTRQFSWAHVCMFVHYYT